MIPNKYTNETIHVANWLLHSGSIDPTAMYDVTMRKATKLADERRQAEALDDEEYNWIRDDLLAESLVEAIEDAFTSAIGEVIPEFDGLLAELTPICGSQESDYQNTSWVVLALFAEIEKRINYYGVADIIAEHFANLTPA